MLSRILVALLAVAFVVFSDPAEAQREGCWPSAFGGWQCSSNCRVTACNDYYDARGQIRQTCRFRCLPRQPQAFAPQPQFQQPVQRAQPISAPQVRPEPPPKPVSEYRAIYEALWSMTPYLQYGIFVIVAAYLLIARQGYFDVVPEYRPSLGGVLGTLAFLSFVLIFNSVELGAFAQSGWREGTVTSFGWFTVFLIYAVIRFLKRFLMGWHYLFVAHPAAPTVNTAVAHNAPIDAASLKSALMPSPEELTGQPRKWAFQYKTEAAQARALKERLDADTAIARAAVDRERARRAR